MSRRAEEDCSSRLATDLNGSPLGCWLDVFESPGKVPGVGATPGARLCSQQRQDVCWRAPFLLDLGWDAFQEGASEEVRCVLSKVLVQPQIIHQVDRCYHTPKRHSMLVFIGPLCKFLWIKMCYQGPCEIEKQMDPSKGLKLISNPLRSIEFWFISLHPHIPSL